MANRPYHVLLIGVETPFGQAMLSRLNEHFQPLKVAAPAKIYDDSVSLPPYLLPVNLQSPTEDSFQQVRTVVTCAPELMTDALRRAVDAADAKLIDVPSSYTETVVEGCFAKFGFRPESMSAGQSASGLGLVGTWYVAHRRPLRRVIRRDGKWVINQGTITVRAGTDEAVEVEHFIPFRNRFWAWLFWLFALILRLIPPYQIKPPSDGNCDWEFSGETKEHDQVYEFKAAAQSVKAKMVRPDLAVIAVLDQLEIVRNEAAHWPAFNLLTLRLLSYRLKN
jgi:hypothetical protein